MKRWKKTLFAICALPVLVVLLAVVLTPLVRMRQASMKPLNPETLAEFGITRLDKTDLPRASPMPGDAAGTDASKDTNTTESLQTGANSKRSLRLARPARVDEARPTLALSLTGWRRTAMRASLGVRKRMEAVAWLVKPDSTGNLAMQIGDRACQVGDYAAARDYYREALRTGKQAFSWKLVGSLAPEKMVSREIICAELAWLEEDTEVATALLQESCASNTNKRWALFRAMHLSILTDSDDLAEYYFKRWSDLTEADKVKRWTDQDDGRWPPKIQAWRRCHRSKPGD